MTTWIEQSARKKSIGQVVLFLVVTAIVAWIVADTRAYWKVFFHGPPPAAAADLDLAEHEVNGLEPIVSPYITIAGEKVLNTDVQEVTTFEGVIKNVSAGYYALKVGNRLLIVKSKKEPSTTIAGELDPMPADVKSSLFPDGSDPADVAVVYPLLLDTNYRDSGWAGVFWVVVAEGLFGFFAWRSWRRLSGAVDHPAIARARTWGDLAVTSAEVEREVETAVKIKTGGWKLTQNYAVKQALLSFDLFRLENLVWAYKKATKRRVYAVIPAGTTYTAELLFSDGKAVIGGKQKAVEELLALVTARSPWAAKGYSDELAKFYNSSRNSFEAEVAARKKEMLH